jgi:hypothetical protein
VIPSFSVVGLLFGMTRLRKPLERCAKFAAILVLAALGALPVPALERERLFGPEIKTGDYKHPASFTELHNGDLFVVFFSGRGEYKDNQAAVFGSRLKAGMGRWSKPVSIASNPFHALGNAVIWEAPDRVVWLFYVTRYGELWSDSRITAKISRDGAKTWSEPFQVTFEAGTMVRNRPVLLTDGQLVVRLVETPLVVIELPAQRSDASARSETITIVSSDRPEAAAACNPNSTTCCAGIIRGPTRCGY